MADFFDLCFFKRINAIKNIQNSECVFVSISAPRRANALRLIKAIFYRCVFLCGSHMT